MCMYTHSFTSERKNVSLIQKKLSGTGEVHQKGIHVERVIGQAKTIKILKHELPISEVALTSRIVFIWFYFTFKFQKLHCKQKCILMLRTIHMLFIFQCYTEAMTVLLLNVPHCNALIHVPSNRTRVMKVCDICSWTQSCFYCYCLLN